MEKEGRANLVEVSFDELHFLGFFEKPRPELGLGHLLPQDNFNTAPGMVGLGLLLIDFLVELELNGIFARLALAGEGEFVGRKFKLVILGDVGSVYRQVDDIL